MKISSANPELENWDVEMIDILDRADEEKDFTITDTNTVDTGTAGKGTIKAGTREYSETTDVWL